MISSQIRAILPYDLSAVWRAVTDIKNYGAWRSDLSHVEVKGKQQFIEYTKSGYATNFVTTQIDSLKQWEFDLENGNMRGHWIGIFQQKGSGTEVIFTEYVTIKKFFLKPFVKLYLKRQQKQFLLDLKNYLHS